MISTTLRSVTLSLLLIPAAPEARAMLRGPAQVSPSAADTVPLAVNDGPLSETNARLLGLAFRSASALPISPHIKNRSRAQASVVELALELDQPERALAYLAEIENWRRGLACADLAFYCATHGDVRAARRLADRAHAIAEAPGDEARQGWRKDRINVRVAQVLALVGDDARARELESGVVASELGKVEAVRASVSDGEEFDAHLATVEVVAEAGDFERVRNALEVCSRLFDRYYEDEARRARVEQRIESLWDRLPATVHLDLCTTLSRIALNHGDPAKALDLVNEAQGAVDSAVWPPADDVALNARLARARFECGDEQRAYRQANRALAHYEEHSDEIVDIFQAEALRPLAEAFRTMGDGEAAALVYRMALEAGVANPNSRPRAEDLTATCLSMASASFEPDPGLWARLTEVLEGLGAPW